MANDYSEKVIMSIGGSLVVPNGGVDTTFLSKLNTFIRSKLAQDKPHFAKATRGKQFFLVVGGGATARHYRDAGSKVIGHLTEDDLDWLGIHATRLNAHLVRTIFRDIAHPKIIEHYDIVEEVSEPVVVASGWKPGWSTDFDAVMLCEMYGARIILNLSNIDQVYDNDPRNSSDAKPISKISWDEFRSLIGDKWTPGMNAPFDPIASKRAQEIGVKVVVLDGSNFENLENYFDGKEFVGTVIS